MWLDINLQVDGAVAIFLFLASLMSLLCVGTTTDPDQERSVYEMKLGKTSCCKKSTIQIRRSKFVSIGSNFQTQHSNAQSSDHCQFAALIPTWMRRQGTKWWQGADRRFLIVFIPVIFGILKKHPSSDNEREIKTK